MEVGLCVWNGLEWKGDLKMNEEKYVNTIQTILDTAIEKYCVQGECGINSIINFLNVAEDMSFMWNLKENNLVERTCIMINDMIHENKNKFKIIKENHVYKLMELI